MKPKNRNWMLMLFAFALAVTLLANHALAASGDKARQLSQGESAKVSGAILARDGDLIRVHLVPVGYGATHPVASNQDAQGRDLNRHVDIKVLVNTSASVRQGM